MKLFITLLILSFSSFANMRDLTFFPKQNDIILTGLFNKISLHSELNSTGSQKFSQKFWGIGLGYSFSDRFNIRAFQGYSEFEQKIRLGTTEYQNKGKGESDPSLSMAYRIFKQSSNNAFNYDIVLSLSPNSGKALDAESAVKKEGNQKRGDDEFIFEIIMTKKSNDIEYLMSLELEVHSKGESFSSLTKDKTKETESHVKSLFTFGAQKNLDEKVAINFLGFISHEAGIRSIDLNSNVSEKENGKSDLGLFTTFKYSFSKSALLEFKMLTLKKFSDLIIKKNDSTSLELRDLKVHQTSLNFIYKI